MRRALSRKSAVSIGGAVAFGAFTPFCACGTMAVIVSMLTTALPWGPIMAFLTSSPLMSPDEFILYSGIVGIKFAVALTLASVIIGLGSGYLTHLIEKKTHFLDGQARLGGGKVPSFTRAAPAPVGSGPSLVSCSCSTPAAPASGACCAPAATFDLFSEAKAWALRLKLDALARVFWNVGVKKVLLFFSVFAALGFLINRFVPASLITRYMGAGNSFAVPLLALVGLPLYVNGSSALPLINALISGGASQGGLLAFMITGPGTSAGVLAGLLTIMKKKAIGLYTAYLLVFAIALGYLYDWLLALGL